MKKYTIEELDVSQLTETEKKVLEIQLQKTPYNWKVGLFIGVLSLASEISYFIEHGYEANPFFIPFFAGIKGIIFIGLAAWARSRSLAAAFLLLVWHLYSNSGMLMSEGNGKTFYIIVACVFLGSLYGAHHQRTLIKKCLNS